MVVSAPTFSKEGTPALGQADQNDGFMNVSEPAPTLRRDLVIEQSLTDDSGAETYVLHDPVTHRFFTLGRDEVDLLTLVDGRSADQISAAANRRFGLDVTNDDIAALFSFLRGHDLVRGDDAQEQRHKHRAESGPSLVERVLKGYITFRVPLFRLDAFLSRTLPAVRFLGHPATGVFLALIGLLGLYLTSRQWDIFAASFIRFLTPEGVATYLILLVFSKAAHELGHAYVAKSKGLAVPTIGIAFIVFWPIAYTDTTEAWKLKSRKDRLQINLAGVATELGMAALCLFLWTIMDDGPIRSVFFLLATTSWVISLTINLNPLMKFDGYFILADLLNVRNMEGRAHAVGRWWLARTFLGDPGFPPEPHEKVKPFLAYALSIWVYRLFLFIGIAVLVYLLVPAPIGPLLAAVEIYYFIGRPVFREGRKLALRSRELGQTSRSILSLLILFGAVLLCFLPVDRHITAPALLQPVKQVLFAPEDGLIVTAPPENGTFVDQNAIVFSLASTTLEFQRQEAALRVKALQNEAAALGIDFQRRERAQEIQADIMGEKRVLNALDKRASTLAISSLYAGEISNRTAPWVKGDWIAKGTEIAAIQACQNAPEIVAYTVEADVGRLNPGSPAIFYSADGSRAPVTGRIKDIDPVGSPVIRDVIVTASTGGEIAGETEENGQFQAYQPYFRLTITADETWQNETAADKACDQPVLRGRLVADADAKSPAALLFGKIQTLLNRDLLK